MKSISNARIALIVAITILSLSQTWPTARYYYHLTKRPAMVGQQPFAETNRPADNQKEELKAWEARNPKVVAWRKQNPAYVAWDESGEQLLSKAIPLGLDLRGGVDVTLALDSEKTIINKVAAIRDDLRRDHDFQDQKLSFQVQDGVDPTKVTIRVTDPKDAQTVADLIAKKYKTTIDHLPLASELRAGPVSFGLDAQAAATEMKGDLGGAMKAIQDRIDALGVTQPKISLQGEKEIRVQVPGEKNPDRIIRNVIQPAQLEFHIVSPGFQQYIGSDGKIKPGTVLPPGTAVYPGKVVNKTKSKAANGQTVYDHYDFVLKKNPELTGADLRAAGVTYNPTDLEGAIQVSLEFKPEGAQKFAEITKKQSSLSPQGQMAILLDGVVRSDPILEVPIMDGRAVIRGGFTQEEATELSQVLKAGALPAPLKVIGKRAVGANMGEQSIQMGVNALVWGTLLIAAFMIVYYGMAGVISIVALVLNVLMVLAIMALSRATLTLSGIGGILLTIGMAVDANVLIYERIREELDRGRPLRQAIALGSHHAFAVIIDSHVTSLITALILLQFTEGSVFGFALTMTFGLLANLYTGLTVTYALCVLWFNWRGALSLGKFRIFHNVHFDFIGMRWFSFGLSWLLIAGSVIAVLVKWGGIPMGVDFKGGISAEVNFDQATDDAKLRNVLKDMNMSGGSVTRVLDQKNAFIIDMPFEAAKGGGRTSGNVAEVEAKLRANLDKAYPAVGNAAPYTITRVNSFDAQMGQKFWNLAMTVVFFASIAILLYLWFRFELVFGVAAIIALVHDLTIVTFFCTLWGLEMSLDEVAALMVLLGFSVNDTIVIFDRIRENTRTVFGKTFKEHCNDAMNQTLSRTFITSGTVFFASLMLLVFGGPGLAPFAKIVVLGSIVGTYSSDFLATPLVYMWNEYRGNKIQEELAAKRRKKVEPAKPVRSSVSPRAAE